VLGPIRIDNPDCVLVFLLLDSTSKFHFYFGVHLGGVPYPPKRTARRPVHILGHENAPETLLASIRCPETFGQARAKNSRLRFAEIAAVLMCFDQEAEFIENENGYWV
jgi:hypothetical protein